MILKCQKNPGGGGGGGVYTPYNGQYGEALPERGTFLRLQVKLEQYSCFTLEVKKEQIAAHLRRNETAK